MSQGMSRGMSRYPTLDCDVPFVVWRDQPIRGWAEIETPADAGAGECRFPGGKASPARVRSYLAAPREEMVPSKEPVVVPAAVSYSRSAVKLPVAPAKRPVPPVIVAVSSM